MPSEVVLMMDLAGVLTTSPFPVARRLAENMMKCVFERAGSHMINKVSSSRSVSFLARQYSNFFFTVTDFTERTRGSRSCYEKLELGEINRLEFLDEFRAEIDFMLAALLKHNPEELELMNIAYPKRVNVLKNRFPLLADPIIQVLIRELLDVEAFLCTIEKVSLRKNVLNLLYYLRVKSQQEIRLFAMGNSWEAEGQYRRMIKASQASVDDSSVFPVHCPILYAGSPHRSFHVNGLFDGYIQSYRYHKRKPYPDIYMHAIDEVMSGRMPSGEALRYDIKPYIFYFDDVASHCAVARNLPGNPFSEVFLIEDGAGDVYKDILTALSLVAAKDPFWQNVMKGVEKEIAPLFKTPVDARGKTISWVTEELANYNNNLLFIPPPPHDGCTLVNPHEKERYHLDEDDQDAILYYCAQHLPHLFPLDIPEQPTRGMKLAGLPGFATSSGPITFEYLEGSKFFQTFRITLRTGSYILRIQPRGKTSPYSLTGLRHEFDTMEHLCQTAPAVRVPQTLIYCDSYAVCGRRFYLCRYRDGDIIRDLRQLIKPRIRRPYSQRRVVVNAELNPRHFFTAAVKLLANLHDATLPRFMKRKEEELRRNKHNLHPLHGHILSCQDMYRNALSCSKGCQSADSLRSNAIESLMKQLALCFDEQQLGQQMIPSPTRLVLIHGGFSMSSLIWSHRSLEGRAKYPPAIVGLTNWQFTRLDDPLLDVANLAFCALVPPPEGIFAITKHVQMLFPSAAEILDSYCNIRGYLRHLDWARREDIFNVYLATLCLQRSCRIVAELAAVIRENPAGLRYADSRNIALADQIARRGLDLLIQRADSKL